MGTKGELDDFLVLGRPLKPVALGMSVLMATLAVTNFTHAGELKGTILGDVVAITSATSFTMLMIGWLHRSQSAAEAGLLLACLTYVLRTWFVLFSVGPTSPAVWLGLGAAIIAGGAWLLERWDHRKKALPKRVKADGG